VIAAAELAAQRLLTKVFVEADVLAVVLYRTTRTSDGTGGSVVGPAEPLAPQRMRLIPMGDGAQERFTADGAAVTPSYRLLGLHTADMERGDTFTIAGRRYEIVFINENRQYEIKGEVAYRGE
jgi:hypothetical protein